MFQDLVKEILVIQVIPSDVNPELLVDYSSIGKVVSTANTINVNKMSYGYSIVFKSDEFEMIPSLKNLVENIKNLMTKNLPGKYFDVSFEYHYMRSDDEDDIIDEDIFKRLVSLQTLFRLNSKLNSSDKFNVFISASMQNTLDDIRKWSDEDDEESDENDDDLFLFGEMAPEIEKEKNKALEDFGFDLEALNNSFNQNQKKNKKNKKKANCSRVLLAAENPKKAYRRHGVVVVKGTKAIDKDAKIIKSFLKEFIPGDQEWKKDLRHDLCSRWLKMYVVTNRQLKELEKQHKKKVYRKHSYDVNKTLDFTRRLFTVPIDSWNDPTR